MPSPIFRDIASILSPLRYPGGKRRFGGYIGEVLKVNSLRPKVFIEPFAGGASVSIQLLNDGLVDSIALGELDPLVASFWKVVFNPTDNEWLIDEIKRIHVSLKKWDYFKTAPLTTQRERALACLFLNRTSFSGILNKSAGPIGGRKQESDYKINCRFPKTKLAKRIRQLGSLASRVKWVNEGDYLSTIRMGMGLAQEKNDICFYFDPPFYHKARKLYRHYFKDEDHKNLHAALDGLSYPWILSYDPADEIKKLYSENTEGTQRIDSLYSTNMTKGQQKVQELIVTNLRTLPKETRLWRSDAEWQTKRPATIIERSHITTVTA